MHPVANVARRNRKKGGILLTTIVRDSDFIIVAVTRAGSAHAARDTQESLGVSAVPPVSDDVSEIILNGWFDPGHHGDVARKVKAGSVVERHISIHAIEIDCGVSDTHSRET